MRAVSVTPAVARTVRREARSEQAEAILAPGTAILAELNSGLDSKKLKPDDKVTAHTTEPLKSADGRTIMPRGTKLEGRVTMADARSKGGSASMLGIQFDKAELKDGTEIALNVVIQAMAPRQSSGPVGGDDDSSPRTIGTNQTSPMGGGTRLRRIVRRRRRTQAEDRREIFRRRAGRGSMSEARARWG